MERTFGCCTHAVEGCGSWCGRDTCGHGLGSRVLFALNLIEPLGIGHGGARGEHADPGAVGRLGEEDRDAEAACENRQAGDVVLMLVSDEDCVEFCRILSGDGHAAEKLAAGETCVDKDAGAGGRDDGAIALRPRGQHCHTHHEFKNTPVPCGYLGTVTGLVRGFSGGRVDCEDIGKKHGVTSVGLFGVGSVQIGFDLDVEDVGGLALVEDEEDLCEMAVTLYGLHDEDLFDARLEEVPF